MSEYNQFIHVSSIPNIFDITFYEWTLPVSCIVGFLQYYLLYERGFRNNMEKRFSY